MAATCSGYWSYLVLVLWVVTLGKQFFQNKG
jgi:hypothetical protein